MSRQPSSIPAIDRPARPRRPTLAGGIPPRIFAICLTSILVAVHYTNYGPLIPTLMRELHISSGQIGLLFAYAHNFVLAFGFIMLFGCVAITASFLAGPAVRREGS